MASCGGATEEADLVGRTKVRGTISSILTVPSNTVSSMLKPLRTSVRSPFFSPRSPPRVSKAPKFLGFRSLFSWSGEKVNLLFSTSGSGSLLGSGLVVPSSPALSSPSALRDDVGASASP